MKNLIGKTAYAVTGPGQSPMPGLCDSIGKIVAIDETRFGDYLIVIWEDGELGGRWERLMPHTVRKAGRDSGIGVYTD